MIQKLLFALIILSLFCCDRDSNELPKISGVPSQKLTAFLYNKKIVEVTVLRRDASNPSKTSLIIENVSGNVIKGISISLESCLPQNGIVLCSHDVVYTLPDNQLIDAGKTVEITVDGYYQFENTNTLYITKYLSDLVSGVSTAGYYPYSNIEKEVTGGSSVTSESGNASVYILADGAFVIRALLFGTGTTTPVQIALEGSIASNGDVIAKYISTVPLNQQPGMWAG